MESLVSFQNSKDLHFQYIFNLLQRFQSSLKFYDIRNYESFKSNHLRVATQIFPDIVSIDNHTVSSIIHEKDISRLRRFVIIIACNDDHESTGRQLERIFQEKKCKETYLLKGINEFMEKYPFLCSSYRKLHVHDFPNEIIPNFLYLGSQDHAHNYDVIDSLKITHILNVTKSSPNAFPGINYRRVYVEDLESEKISLYFHKAYEFIEHALDENMQGANNVVLVHCAQGISRSATIVIMFLMRATGISVEQAMRFVKRQRDIIEPNEGFMKELQAFDERDKKFVRRASNYARQNTQKVLQIQEIYEKVAKEKRNYNKAKTPNEIVGRKHDFVE